MQGLIQKCVNVKKKHFAETMYNLPRQYTKPEAYVY